MKIIEFLKDIFTGKNGEEKTTAYLTDKMQDTYILNLQMFAIEMCINLISSIIAKCKFKTFLNNEEHKGDEYYLWNIRPNVNQNSTQFIQELIHNLLYNNEVLVVDVNGQLLIADSYSSEEYAILPNKFTNVTCGDLTFKKKFFMDDVLYFKLNENDINILLSSVMSGYTEIMEMAVKKYKRAGGRKGKVTLDKTRTGDKSTQEALEKLFNEQFRNYFENENAVIQLDRGIEYDEISGEGSKKSTSEVADIMNIRKEAMTSAALALRIPPALILGEIADVETVTDNFLTFCIEPIIDLLESEIIGKRYGKKAFISGSYIKIDTTCIKHIDIFSVAEKIDKLISTGVYCIDELREKLGETPLNTWWSKIHFITKNYDKIENVEGGENIENDKNQLGSKTGGE